MPRIRKSTPDNSLNDSFLDFISREKLIKSEEKILLTVSGGVDSMVMLDLFRRNSFMIAIAHCNFQLRGKESDGDERLLMKLAVKSGIDFYSEKFETIRYSKEKKISVQMAARELRYAWFEKIRSEKKFDWVATAHHKDDEIETLLLNLIRGTGIHGLAGIPVKRNRIIRPLLFASKNELLSYANKNKLAWREDKSNRENKYRRNSIRNKLIPLLKKRNPQFETGITVSMEKFKAAALAFDELAKSIRNRAVSKRGSDTYISKKEIKKLTAPGAFLFEFIKGFGFNFDQVKDILSGQNKSGRVFHSDTHILADDRQAYIITRQEKPEIEEFSIKKETKKLKIESGILEIETLPVPLQKEIDANVALVDFDKVKFPLVVRKWQHGDKFQPLGMRGKKKISDFMIDRKIPVNLKNRVHVLTSNNEIVWVVGMRIDERFKLTSRTKKALRIKFTQQ